jgi:hypothetical protein
VEVRLDGDTVWLSQKQMAELFQKNIRTVNGHIRNIFEEGELMENSVIRNFRITAADGKNYDTQHYNLDVIISVGYRVKSGSDCLENQAIFGFQNSFFATIVLRIVSNFLIAAITAVILALPTDSNL